MNLMSIAEGQLLIATVVMVLVHLVWATVAGSGGLKSAESNPG